MNGYYLVTQKLKNLLLLDEDVNTVTKGDPSTIDDQKKNIFPLVHIEVFNSQFDTTGIIFNIRLFAYDLRNTNNTIEVDKFIGNDNEDDNLNTMLMVLYRLYQQLHDMDPEEEGFSLIDWGEAEIFMEKGANVVDGWEVDIEFRVDEMYIGRC